MIVKLQGSFAALFSIYNQQSVLTCHLDGRADEGLHDIHVHVADVVPDDEVVDVLPHLVRPVTEHPPCLHQVRAGKIFCNVVKIFHYRMLLSRLVHLQDVLICAIRRRGSK